MNGSTATLLNKWSKKKGYKRRVIKRLWNSLSQEQRAETRQMIRYDLMFGK